jgi:hypothetical protein
MVLFESGGKPALGLADEQTRGARMEVQESSAGMLSSLSRVDDGLDKLSSHRD